MAALKNLGSNRILVPVPPRPGKIAEKGWDQIDELCNYLKYFYGYKVLKLLERKSAVQQKKLNREERLNTIGKSYYMVSNRKIKKILKLNRCDFPEEVCLIDDVSTTGATIESCSFVLKKGGVKKITAMTIYTVD